MLVNQQPYQLPPHYPPASTRKMFGAIARTSPRSLVASVDAERELKLVEPPLEGLDGSGRGRE